MGERDSQMPRWLWVLLLGSFLSTVGALVEVFLTLYLVESRQLTVGTAGLIAGLNGAGIIAGNLLGGGIGDRIGLRRTLFLSTVVSILLLVSVPFTPSAALGAVLGALGFAQGVYRPVSSAVVMEALPSDARRQGMAWLRVSWNAGFVVGPPLGALVAAWNFDAIFVIEAVTAVFLLASVLVIPRTLGRVSESGLTRSTWSALRADPRMVLLLATIVLVDTSYRFAYTAVPLQLRALEAPTWVYGLTISFNGIVIVLLEPFLAGRLRHIGAVRLLSWGFALVGVGWALLIPQPAVAMAFVAVLVVTVGEMLYKPTATAHAADRAPVGMYGRYQSLYAAASISGTFTAPAIVGVVFPVDHRLTWAVGAGLCAAAVALLLLWTRLAPGVEQPDPAPQPG
jgi:MFS family permease